MKTVILFSIVLLLSLSDHASFADSTLNPMATQLSGKSCQIWKDDQGIPHIHASEDPVGIACMGYLHGKERTWQLDFYRRVMQGRKAEIFGRSAIRSDFFLRLLGLKEKADSLFAQMKPAEKDILWAYTYGVNKGIQEALKDGVYEFKRFNYLPDPWLPQDTVGVILVQSFDQTKRSFELQLDSQTRIKDYGDLATSLFNPDGLPWSTTVIKKGEYDNRPKLNSSAPSALFPTSPTRPSRVPVSTESLDESADFSVLNAGISGEGAGSNNWVLSRQRSATQNAWMANDPHLQMSSPPIWYMMHLDTGNLNVMGASFPGLPAIVSGSNEHVSWGLTNAYLPVSRLSFVPEKELEDVKWTRPIIWFRIWKFKLPFFFKAFRKTPGNLPILPVVLSNREAAVLRWTGFDLKPEDLMGTFHLMRARTVAEMDETLSRIGVPAWNFVFADDLGGIGYRAIGRVPRFNQNPTHEISTQSLAELEHSSAFDHPLTPSEMPHLLNPGRGYIVSANNRQFPEDSKIAIGQTQVSSFRAFRIEELLKSTIRHDLGSQQKIQCDLQAVDARFLVPHLLKNIEQSSAFSTLKDQERRALETLRTWNFETNLECTACAIYRRWMDRIFSQQELDHVSLYRKLTQPPGQSFQKLLVDTFRLALDDLNFHQAYTLPQWKDVHLNPFTHLAGEHFFKAKPMSTPGDEHSVNPGTAVWTGDSYFQSYGASERVIVEMSRPPQIYSVLAGPNEDVEKRDMNAPESEWQKWVKCQLQKRHFPVDWSQVTGAVQLQL
jgi:penicillin G amidase